MVIRVDTGWIRFLLLNEDTVKLLKDLDKTKSPGPDGIFPGVWEDWSQQLAGPPEFILEEWMATGVCLEGMKLCKSCSNIQERRSR